MTVLLTDIDPEALVLGSSISANELIYELKEATLQDVGEVWAHRLLPKQPSLPLQHLLELVSRAHNSTTFCKILGVRFHPTGFCFVLPRHQTLLSSITAGGTLPVEQALRCALDVCRCLVELHGHDIHCGVLRPADVLVAPTGTCTVNICSVALNTLLREPFDHPSYFTYMAPEVIMCKMYVNGSKADVWSLACCLCRTLDPDSPWPASQSAQDYCRKVHSSPPTLPACLPSSLAELVRLCFSLSVPERPSVQEVLQGLQAALSAAATNPAAAGLDEAPQQVSQGAVEQASCVQQQQPPQPPQPPPVDSGGSERELASSRAKVKQLERKLQELVLRSNERDEQQQHQLAAAERLLAELREERQALQEQLRSAGQIPLDRLPSTAATTPATAAPSDAPPQPLLSRTPVPPRSLRQRRPTHAAAREVKDTIKEPDQQHTHLGGGSTGLEPPAKRHKPTPSSDPSAAAAAAPAVPKSLRGRAGGRPGSNPSSPVKAEPSGGAPMSVSPRHPGTVQPPSPLGRTALGSPLGPSGAKPLLRPAGLDTGGQPASPRTKVDGAGVFAGRTGTRSRTRAAAARPLLQVGGLQAEGSGPLPAAAEGTPGAKSGAAALLELARGPGDEVEGEGEGPQAQAAARPKALVPRDGRPRTLPGEQSASSSSLTRRDPNSPTAITQPAALHPTLPAAATEPPEDCKPPPAAAAAAAAANKAAPGTAVPSSNSASISTTANVDGAEPVGGGAGAPQLTLQHASSADGLLTDPKMVLVLIGMSISRTPLREDTGPSGALGLIMFCLNRSIAASTSKGQQALKTRLLTKSKQVLAQMASAGWVLKEEGRCRLNPDNAAVAATMDAATEDDVRRGHEAFALWCRKTFVDEVADSRMITPTRSALLASNTPHYLAWLAVITKLGPPLGLNEGAINLLHDTVMCYHCPEIAGSEEFMLGCQALADWLTNTEKKHDRQPLLRKIYTCMAAGFLNKGMAAEAQDMAGKAITAQPKSPDLESAYWIQGAARYNLGLFLEAEESFQKALKHYQNKVAGGLHHMRTLDFLADVRARQGKWREARKTYEEEIAVGQGRGHHAEQEKAHASLAKLLFTMGLYGEADTQFAAALAVQEQTGIQTAASAEYLELRALALGEQYKLQEAHKCLEQAEEIRRSIQLADGGAGGVGASGRLSAGPKELGGAEAAIQVAPTTLVNVAKVAVMDAKYDEAEDYCEEVVQLELEGADDEAAALMLQGQLYVMQHRFKEAKTKLEAVQKLLVSSSDMDKLATLHYWLAQALSHLPGEETMAEEVLIRSMAMLGEKWPASAQPGGAAEFLNPRLECLLGQLQAARGSVNDEQSVKLEGLRRCKAGVEAAAKVWGKQHPHFASCLRHVAWAQMACFSYEAALVTLAEERKVWQALEGGREGLEYAGLAHARAHCHYALQRYGDAERLYRAAAAIFARVYPNSSLHKWSMVGALAALQDGPTPAKASVEPAIKEVCDVVGCNERKLMQWLERHRQYWNPNGRG